MKLELRRVTLATPSAHDARRRWPERQLLLLRLQDANGHFGLGEASPLPGYSPDSLDDTEAALRAVDVSELSVRQSPSPLEELTRVSRLVARELPAARMGLETALLDYWSRRDGMSAPRWLGTAPDARVRLACLIGAALDSDLLERASTALRSGYRILKVKVGASGRLREEVTAVMRLHRSLTDDVRLRLDANRAWTAAEVEEAWLELSRAGIELFEEPGDLPLHLRDDVPVGLDESLQGVEPDALRKRLSHLPRSAVVLKPTVLGGIAHGWRMAQEAEAAGARVVVSHCFEGELGYRACATLALALLRLTEHGVAAAHGLAPHDALSADELPVHAGSLFAWSEPGLGGTVSWP